MGKSLTPEFFDSCESSFQKDSKLKLARLSVAKNGIFASCQDPDKGVANPNVFSLDVKAGGVTNQKQSGRCWMFAGLNVLRPIASKKLGKKDFEFSEAYLQFYDRLEKSNFFLERIIELRDKPCDDFLLVNLISYPNGDGGHYPFFKSLVKKYGLLPIELMPDSTVACTTPELNKTLNFLLSGAAAKLRAHFQNGGSLEKAEEMKEGYLEEVYRILGVSLGLPPKEFVYEYYDKDDKFVRLPKQTTSEFFRDYVGVDLDEYMPLCDAPFRDYPTNKIITCPQVGCVEGDLGVEFFNVGLEPMKKAVIKSLEAGEVVWFAADVSASSASKDGYLINELYALEELFGIDLSSSKKERLEHWMTSCNHAMTFTGVNIDESGKPNRWKVENSWGKENGIDGYFVMDDAWFNEYVYQVYVNKKYVDSELVKQYEESERIEVPPFNTFM